MQASGSDDESQTVEQATLSRRQFGAVRVTVKDREEGDQSRRGVQRRLALGHDGDAKQKRRCSDADFDAGQRNAE